MSSIARVESYLELFWVGWLPPKVTVGGNVEVAFVGGDQTVKLSGDTDSQAGH